MASSVILAFVGNREAIPTPVLQPNLINPLLSSGFGPTKQFAYQEQTVVEREGERERSDDDDDDDDDESRPRPRHVTTNLFGCYSCRNYEIQCIEFAC